jgi:PAS domain S-box-containing protein
MEFEQLRLLVEQLPAMLWTTDEQLTITAIGGAAIKTLAETAPLARAPHQLPAMFDEQTPLIKAHRRALAGEAGSYPVEWKGRTFRCHVRPLQDEQGETVGTIGLGVDITEHREAEHAIRERDMRVQKSESQYRSLIQNAIYGVYYSTGDGRFLEVNPALAVMLGYDSAEDLMAHADLAAIYVDPTERMRLIEQYAGTGRIDGVEVGWKRKDGTPITVRLSGRAVETEPTGTRGFEVIAEDVTARRALEDELRQAQKIEAVGRLAGGIAHDFNNLLTAIFGFSDLALEQLEDGHPARPEVQEVRKAAESAASLTRQLLAFSRKQVLQPRLLNLNETVDRMQTLLQRVIGEHIALVTRLAPSLHDVFADPGQLEQVVMNLAINARDAMPNGGQLAIDTANVTFETVDLARKRGGTGDFVRVTISDTGLGMEESVRARLFEPFFTTKERGRGTGLGLATVYGVVRQSGGFIWVDSVLGRGTTFTLDFPRATDGMERAAPAAAEGAIPGAGETILLVEDLPSVRSVMRELLARNGYQVVESEGGHDALQVAARWETGIDLLLTDVVMPGMSGRELARRVQALRPKIRVLYTSGYTDDLIAHHGVLEAGVSFLQKPFTQQQLLQKLREVLDHPPARIKQEQERTGEKPHLL